MVWANDSRAGIFGGSCASVDRICAGLAEIPWVEKSTCDCGGGECGSQAAGTVNDMKKFLQGLLIGYSLLLCGVIALQWMREANLRAQNKALAQQVFDKGQKTQQMESSLKTADAEVKRLDARVAELGAVQRTNEMTLTELRRDLRKVETTNGALQKQRTDMEESLARQNEIIQKQNKDITDQNAMVKKLASDRNEAVEKMNQRVQEYNGLVTRFNELAKRLETQTATATNSSR